MMVERVWFKPNPSKRGGVKQVPMEPGLTPGLMFPPEGAWTVRSRYIERRLREGAGVLVDLSKPIVAQTVEVENQPAEPEMVRAELGQRRARTAVRRSTLAR